MTVESPKTPADTIPFPLSPGERVLANTIPTANLPGMWAAFNALRHLTRAWMIRELDPQMAVFRSITAEEESASAVFRAVKRLGYSGSRYLNPRNHVHKNALFPFCVAVYRTIADTFCVAVYRTIADKGTRSVTHDTLATTWTPVTT